MPKFTASTTIGNSSISDDGTIVSLLNADSRLYGGSNTGRFIIGNPSVTTYAAIYGNSHATAPSLFQIVANNIAALSIPASGNVGIGTAVPINGGSAAKWVTAEGTTTYGGGFISSVNGNAKGYFYSQDGYAILQGAPSQGVKLMPNGVDGITVFSAGNVFIGTSPTDAGYKLNVSGDFLASGFTKSYTGNVNSDNYFEKVFSNAISFPNGSANLAADVRFGNTSFWGYIEVEVTATYSNQNSAGKLTKVFAVGTNPNNLIYTNESRVVDSMGTISDNIAIGDFSWDSTNSTYKIPISHIVSSGNLYTVKVRMFTHGSGAWTAFNAITISNNYSLTALPRQYPYYNDRLGIGTTLPSAILQANGSNSNGVIQAYVTAGGGSALRLNTNFVNNNYIDLNPYVSGVSNNGFEINQNGTQRLVISGGGNVLIGTTTDAGYKLNVNGTVRIQDNLTVNGGQAGSYFKGGDSGVGSGIANFVDVFGVSAMYIRGDNKIGMGVISPRAALQIDRSYWSLAGSTVSRMLQKNVGSAGDYEQHVILLHPIYNGTLINYNKCSGTIYATRGGTGMGLINDTYNIDTASAYNTYNGSINSTIGYGRLYTCDYNGVKYMALLPDYRTSAVEYDFDGYVKSTGEELKVVVYRMSNSGAIINSEVYNSLTLYGSGVTNYQGSVYTAGNFIGNLSGTADQSSVVFSNSGTTFNSFFDSQTNLTDKNYLIYNTTDAPRGTLGLYTVSINKWYGDYGSMFAVDCEPGRGIGYIKTKYGGTWGSWKMLIDASSDQTISGAKIFNNTTSFAPSGGVVGATFVTSSGTPAFVSQMASGLNAGVGARFGGSNGNAYGSTSIEATTSNYGAAIKIITGVYSASQQAIQFTSNTTSVGSITCTTSATAYNTSSDYRLKENVVALESSINRVKALNPCRFNFITEPEKTVDGFIAHEVQEVIPEAVVGKKDELDYDGSPKYQGIDQSKIVPLLTAALKEAISKIEELENRLSTLENK